MIHGDLNENVSGCFFLNTVYNRKTSVYHTVNGDLHCSHIENSKNDEGYIT